MSVETSRRVRLVVLGVSGSIGRQAMEVVAEFPERFEIVAMTAAGKQMNTLLEMVRKCSPEILVVTDTDRYEKIKVHLEPLGTRVLCGSANQVKLASGRLIPVDMVLSAISGTAGLEPTIAALEAGIDVALANKETLVSGGAFVMDTAHRSGAHILPVDSEHAAIHQCLQGFRAEEVERIILTCSGGPFYAKEVDLEHVTIEEALDHPTWNMGGKITVDSATLMNKGLEVIEAHWLFGIPPDRINVVIHPESIIHSMVEAKDGSVIAQMSRPDMRLPILYALSGGRHFPLPYPKLDLPLLKQLTFDMPDINRFPCLALAYEALECGGTMPAVMNAANEVAVEAFRKRKIRFTDIPRIIRMVMHHSKVSEIKSLEDIMSADKLGARTALRMIHS